MLNAIFVFFALLPSQAEINFITSLRELRLSEFKTHLFTQKPDLHFDHLNWEHLDIFEDWAKAHPEHLGLVTTYEQSLKEFEKVDRKGSTKIQYEWRSKLKEQSHIMMKLVTESPWVNWNYSEVFGDRIFQLQNKLFRTTHFDYFFIQYAVDLFLNFDAVEIYQRLATGAVSHQLMTSFTDEFREQFLNEFALFSPRRSAQIKELTAEQNIRSTLLNSDSFLEAVGVRFPGAGPDFRFFNTQWEMRPNLLVVAKIHLKIYQERLSQLQHARELLMELPSSTFSRAALAILGETNEELESEIAKVLKYEKCDSLLN